MGEGGVAGIPLLAWESFGLAAWIVLSAAATWHVLLNKRLPTSALLWLAVVNFVPLLGPALYTGFGINRIGRRATIKQIRNRAVRGEIQPLLTRDGRGQERPAESDALPPQLDRFATTLANLCRYPATSGNRVELLRGGEVFFPRAVAAIDGARNGVLLETYILRADAVGLELLAALRRAAARGVRCHLLYDSVGSLAVDLVALSAAEAGGVRVSAFTSRHWLRGRLQVNLRNHRKILVVDGEQGFTGGMNVTADHVGLDGAPARVLDYHFALRGPVVQQLTAAFAEDWYFVTGEKLLDPAWYPHPREEGGEVCRLVPSGPDGDYEVFYRVLVAALHSARDSVRVATPYFLPDPAVATALELACLRGVRVQLLVPRRCDHRVVDWAMRSCFDSYLDVGGELWLRPEPFLHAKLLLIDDAWALVGSANLDSRSFRLNYELCLGMAGAGGVAAVRDAFAAELAVSRRVLPAEWRLRGPVDRAWCNFWALWSPLL